MMREKRSGSQGSRKEYEFDIRRCSLEDRESTQS